jgi:methionyl aminopeptidase
VNCISVNDEAVHGIPGRRRLRDGDLVKLDVTAELDGFYADACVSVPVGRPVAATAALAKTARAALTDAVRVARAGSPLNVIGAMVEKAVTGRGHAVCTEQRLRRRRQEVPIISAGTGAVHMISDGWTMRTTDGALAAHAEHTIVVTGGEPIVLTASTDQKRSGR